MLTDARIAELMGWSANPAHVTGVLGGGPDDLPARVRAVAQAAAEAEGLSMSTLRQAAQQALQALKDCVKALDALHAPGDSIYSRAGDSADRAEIALRTALAQPEPRNQCGETCERAKLCAVCAQKLEQTTQTPCDTAEDGVCEVIDCCRNPAQILDALEIGYDSAQAEAAQYHAAMAGYRPERHAAMDADVAKIAKAITAVKAALEQEKQEPTARYKCTVVDDRHPNGVPFEQWVNALQQEQEPVAIVEGVVPHLEVIIIKHILGARFPKIGDFLYTNPPRREWRGLTQIQRMSIINSLAGQDWVYVVDAIEDKLKEKNA